MQRINETYETGLTFSNQYNIVTVSALFAGPILVAVIALIWTSMALL